MKNSIGDEQLQARGFVAFGVLLAYLVFSPLLVQLGIPASDVAVSLMDWQRIFELLTCTTIVMILAPPLLLNKWKLFGVQKWVLYGWVLFFVLGAFSSYLSDFPIVARLEWIWTLLWFLATFLLFQCLPSTSQLFQGAVRTFVFVVFASYATLFYVLNADPMFDPESIVNYGFPGFNNPRVFTDYQTVVLFFIPFAIRGLNGICLWRWLAWVLAGSYVALAFASGSRSLFLGQFVGLVTVVFFGRAGRKDFILGQLRMWFSGIFAYFVLFVLIAWVIHGSPVTNDLARGGFSGRILLWQQALSMSFSHPFFGAGPMHFAAIPNRDAASPHSHVFQLLAEWGVAATIIFVFLSGRFLLTKLRCIQNRLDEYASMENHFVLAIIASFVALVAQSFVSPVFNNPASQMLLSFLVVLIVKVLPCTERAGFDTVRLTGNFLAGISIGVTLFFAWCVVPWVVIIEERTACYIEHKADRPTRHFAPRFWQQGWIFLPCEPALTNYRQTTYFQGSLCPNQTPSVSGIPSINNTCLPSTQP